MLQSFFDPQETEAGCDEAGRGCLAGPVVAAAVILSPDFFHPLLNDSKKLSKQQRNQLRPLIEKAALAWSVAFVSPAEIDEINILKASFLAMHRALDGLNLRPTSLLIDGNRFHPYQKLRHHCIVKGDGKMAAIAAASILAKTHRDAYMEKLADDFPEYGWEKNMGYPTLIHREALKIYGETPHHRRSFRLLPEVLQAKLFD